MKQLTRQEAIDERLWTALVAAKDLVVLTETSDLSEVDLWDLRAQLQSVQTLLIEAAKPLDRALGKEGNQHQRSGDYVVTVRNEVKEKETYRGGSSMPLRVEVACRIADEMTATDREDVDLFATTIANGLAKVWSQPPKSKLPSKKSLKALGLDPDEWLVAESVPKLEVKCWPVEMYEAIIGPAPVQVLIPNDGTEPF